MTIAHFFFFSFSTREIKLKYPNRRWNELKYKFPVKIVFNDNFLVVRSEIETAWEWTIPREKFIPCTFHFSCSRLPSLEKIDLSRANLLRIPSPLLFPQFRASDIRGSNRKFLSQDWGRIYKTRSWVRRIYPRSIQIRVIHLPFLLNQPRFLPRLAPLRSAKARIHSLLNSFRLTL